MTTESLVPATARRKRLGPSRRRYLGFLVPGVALIAIAISLELFTPFADIFAHIAAELGVALTAIALIDFLWFQLGGSPVEQQVSEFSEATDDALGALRLTTDALHEFQQSGIGHLEDQIASFSHTTNEALGELRTATVALGDLQDLGITRLYSERIEARADRIVSWQKRLLDAKEVDLMGLTLWDEWFSRGELRQAIQHVITTNKGIVRVVLLPKDNAENYTSKDIRMKQPGEAGMEELLPNRLNLTYGALDRMMAGPLGQTDKASFQVRVTTYCIIYALILRIDNYAFIAPYVASEVGEDSFAFEIEGAEKRVFTLYKGEFESVFGKSSEYKANAKGEASE